MTLRTLEDAVWIFGWAMSHWVDSPTPLFGAVGLLPVPIALMLSVFGGALLVGRSIDSDQRL